MHLGYGIYQNVRNKRRECRVHIYSSLLLLGLALSFSVFVASGNYATI